MKTLRNLFAAALATAAIIFTVGCPTSPETPPEETVEAVTFNPDGGDVKQGNSVRLSTATTDAEIYYVVNPANPITDANVESMISGNSMIRFRGITTDVPITEACTIYAVARRPSTGTLSKVSSAAYTLAIVPSPVTFDPAAGTVASGTKVKLSATPATGEDSYTIYYSTTTELTDDNYKDAGTEYNASAEDPGIAITGNTTIYAVAVGTTNNPGISSSATYSLPVTLMSAAPEADDVVYIYYPSGKNVMLSTGTTKLGASGEITMDETLGGFTPQENYAALSVFKNDIGQYVFVSGGKYLTSGATGNSLTLADTFSYLALWEVVPVSSGSNEFYIHSANAIYGSSRQSLEYYSGFTVYTRNTTEIYKFQFYKDPNKNSELDEQGKAALAVSANTLEEPKFSVDAGEVTPYTITRLSSASLDAEFWYTTDSTKADKEHLLEMTKYDDSKGIVITGNKGDSVTYYALAGRLKSAESTTEGVFSTAVASVTYTIGEDTNTYIPLATSLAENDVVVIYYPNGQTSISSTAQSTGFAPFDTTVTAKGMAVKKGDVSENLTFFTAKEYAPGDYVFINGGKYLTSGATGSTLTLSESLTKYALWNLEEVNSGSNDGNFFVKNKNAINGSNAQYLQFDSRNRYNVFTVYRKNNNEQFTYQFYKMTGIEADKAQAKVFSPEFSVPSGQALASETPIIIESDDTDAEYYWKWKSEGDLTAENYATAGTKYDATVTGGEPKVTKEDTLQAIAVKGGVTSNVVTATYSVDNTPKETFTIASATSVTDSDGNNLNSGKNAPQINVNFTDAKSTIVFGKTSGTNPRYDGSYIRMYGSGTLTITSTDKNITKIEIAKTEGDSAKGGTLSADVGSIADDKIWTGDSKSVVFTRNSSGGHFRITEIVVYYAE